MKISSCSAQNPSFLYSSLQILAASEIPKLDICLLYFVRLLLPRWAPRFWDTVWKLNRQNAKIIGR